MIFIIKKKSILFDDTDDISDMEIEGQYLSIKN